MSPNQPPRQEMFTRFTRRLLGPFELEASELSEASDRIHVIAIFGAIGFVFYAVVGFAKYQHARGPEFAIFALGLGLGFGLCLLLTRRFRPFGELGTVRQLLWTQIIVCTVIAFFSAEYAARISGSGLAFFTWISPIILIVPFLVPIPSGVVGLISLICALMKPISLFVVSHWHADLNPDLPDYAMVSAGPFVASLVAHYGAEQSRERLRTERSRRTQLETQAVELKAQHREMGRVLAQLKRYRFEKLLAEGGMGLIFLVKDLLVEQELVLKVIRPKAVDDNPDYVQALFDRFKGEATTLFKLRSGHTVRLFRFDVAKLDEIFSNPEDAYAEAEALKRMTTTVTWTEENREGLPFIVMEFLDGVPLDVFQELYYDDGPIPPARVIHVLRQTCDSLREAHAMGAVHRDIKPDNLFFCRDYAGRRDVVKVLDFGLVNQAVEERPPEALAATAQRPPGRPSLTQFRKGLMGTPGYTAPESISEEAVNRDRPENRRRDCHRGHTMAPGAAATMDVYSLGCVAYTLLTGYRFGGYPWEQLHRAVCETVPPPSSRVEGLPEALDRLVMDCLERDPALRPRSMREVEDRLAAIAQSYPWTEQDALEFWAGKEDKLEDYIEETADSALKVLIPAGSPGDPDGPGTGTPTDSPPAP